MLSNMENFVAWMGGTLVSAFIGSYLSAYMKRKGENLATHEDLQNLIDQVKATTEATKAIEARISQDVWDRQRRWEMKRDVLHSFVVAAYAANEALLTLKNVCEALQKDEFSADLQSDQISALEAGNSALQKLEEQRLLALLACGPEFNQAAHRLVQVAKGMYSQIADDPFSYDYQQGTFKAAIAEVITAARTEIGYAVEEQPTP